MARSVVISGGTGGLGTAVTRVMLDDGWRVIVPFIEDRELERLAPHPALETVRADLFDGEQAAAVVARAGERLDALVNLVGGFAEGGRVHETPIEEFEKQFDLNLRPAYLLCQAAVPRMLAAGGAIVCVSTR